MVGMTTEITTEWCVNEPVTAEKWCPTCEGSGVCTVCRGGSIPEPGLDCQCQATHECLDCYGLGTYAAYATEQMLRLTAVLRRDGINI